jgi:hypothetical protein
MGECREGDAAGMHRRKAAPVEREAGGRRLERHRQASDRRPNVPQRKRREDMRVLDWLAMVGDALPDRIGCLGEAELDEPGMTEQRIDPRRERAKASRSPGRSIGGGGRSSVRWRWSPGPKTIA